MEKKKVNNKRKRDEISNTVKVEEEEKKSYEIKDEELKQTKVKKLKKSKESPELVQGGEVGDETNNKINHPLENLFNKLRLINYVSQKTKNKEIIPVYSFDQRFLNRKVKKYDTLKCGLVRTRFILESAQNFRDRLEKIGSKLLVTMDKPEDFLPQLIDKDVDNTIVQTLQ